MHRLLARRATIDRRGVLERADGVIEHGDVVGVHDRLHRRNIRVPAERSHGPEYYGLATDHTVLLGSSRAGTESAPGGDEDGSGALRSGHASSRTCRANRFCWVSRDRLISLRRAVNGSFGGRTALTMPGLQGKPL
jgi:hypothetical protein